MVARCCWGCVWWNNSCDTGESWLLQENGDGGAGMTVHVIIEVTNWVYLTGCGSERHWWPTTNCPFWLLTIFIIRGCTVSGQIIILEQKGFCISAKNGGKKYLKSAFYHLKFLVFESMNKFLFSTIMLLFYQDEAQETKFKIFLPSLNVCTGEKCFFR